MGSMRVVITDFTDLDLSVEEEVFNASGLDIDLVSPEKARAVGLPAATAGADALLVQFATIDADLIRSLSSCRVISRYGIGVDMIDLVAASRAGIQVANVPDFCIDEVSTQTVGFLIDLNRHTWALNDHVHAGRWGSPIKLQPPRRLKGQTLGLVGLGAIGREVARKSAALGLQVLAHDPYVEPESDSLVTMHALDDLLERSDYVSIHCPLNQTTMGLLGQEQLARMKPTAYLLNLSRGKVLDEDALHEALVSGGIAGAALDVMVTEPPSTENPLLHMNNVIITPHTSSWSIESVAQLRRDAAINVVDALSGRRPRFVVNRLLLDLQPRET